MPLPARRGFPPGFGGEEVPAPTSLCAQQGGRGSSCPREGDEARVTLSEARGVGQELLY